jgi:hypothetical protein
MIIKNIEKLKAYAIPSEHFAPIITVNIGGFNNAKYMAFSLSGIDIKLNFHLNVII